MLKTPWLISMTLQVLRWYSTVQYSTVQKLSVCRATLERLHHGVHCPPPPGPHPPGPRDPAEGDGQEIYHGGGNEEGNIARHTEND